jgi:cytochrome c-type biogenesis protein CcmH
MNGIAMVRGLVLACGLAASMGVGGAPEPARAVQPEEQLADPALEARAREISKQLRCVVCDNQTIDESDAQVAGDMRRFVRAQLEEGASDKAIMDQMVEFYGEYVLLRPRFSLSNAFIWAAPALALLIGLIWVRRRIRRPEDDGAAAESAAQAAESPAAPPLSAEEEARLEALLDRDAGARGARS